jgi:hypothetical protein
MAGRRSVCALGRVAGLAAGAALALAGLVQPAAAGAVATTPIDFHAWTSRADFASGHLTGGATLARDGGALSLNRGRSRGTWTSRPLRPGFRFSELVSSWQADTPAHAWVATRLRVRAGGHWSKWYVMGRWAFDTSTIKRTSVSGQGDADGTIAVDTYFARSGNAPGAYRLREVLHSTRGARPVVRQVAATASHPAPPSPTPSRTTIRSKVDLHVPRYSQEVHRAEYPQFGGGEAWASPTSTEMVVEYWDRGPSRRDLRSLPPDAVFDAHGRADPSVDWAALHTYDWDYQGTGNWPFNTAYASHYGLDGSVRQFDSLRGLESWIKRGVPLVVSIAWDNTDADPSNDLDGADISRTDGDLIVVRGFTARGDVIANDPASPTDAEVRHVYRRDQFEHDWLSGSNGIVYLIKPPRIRG